MKTLPELFDNNRQWARDVEVENPGFFEKLSRQQSPQYLWIGCADSRVPANEIVGLMPGELFVHRNVANLATQTDINFLSVLQFAVEVLKVKHVIVCGHYGCGGVSAALSDEPHGLIDNWLRQIKELAWRHREKLDVLEGRARVDRLCELNVQRQVINVARTTVVQEAWARGQALSIHGWIYGISDGLLRDLEFTLESNEDVCRLRDSV